MNSPFQIWRPFTQMHHFETPISITHSKGLYLYDQKGKSYQDWISSWWVNIHGHAHPFLAQAIYKQAQQLEQVIFTQFTHEPAEKLAQALTAYLPKNLHTFFYSDNGSTAVEVAIKMAYQYFFNQGKSQKKLFLSLEGSYHGDTFGAMSISQSDFHQIFEPFCFERKSIFTPFTFIDDPDLAHKENRALAALDEVLQKYSDQICAMIFEPLVQGAAGMRMYRAEFLEKIMHRLREREILIIFDEVMTGFGRTGSFFAMDQLSSKPDLLCLSKALTGGMLPLALTLCSSEIYEAFLSNHWQKVLKHGHSYTANPLSCAVALASLELFKIENTMEKIQNIHQFYQKNYRQLLATEFLFNARILGSIFAIDFLASAHDFTFEKRKKINQKCLEQGIFLRPLGNTFYLLPPYCVQEKELSQVFDVFLQLKKFATDN